VDGGNFGRKTVSAMSTVQEAGLRDQGMEYVMLTCADCARRVNAVHGAYRCLCHGEFRCRECAGKHVDPKQFFQDVTARARSILQDEALRKGEVDWKSVLEDFLAVLIEAQGVLNDVLPSWGRVLLALLIIAFRRALKRMETVEPAVGDVIDPRD